jgi:hypothetical protein
VGTLRLPTLRLLIQFRGYGATVATGPQDAITWWALISAFGGSLIGGTISTVIALVVQNRSFNAAKKQRDDDRHETRKAQAYSLFFKMVRIHSSIVLLGQGNSESLKSAGEKGLEGDLWRKILPHGNFPPPVKFTPEEMALVLSLDITLFNDLGPYDDIHNSFLDLFSEYARRRSALTEKFGAKMHGDTGTTSLTKEEYEWMAPRAHDLNGLAQAMLQRAEQDSKESRELLTRLHALFVKEFGLSPKLEFKPPANAI